MNSYTSHTIHHKIIYTHRAFFRFVTVWFYKYLCGLTHGGRVTHIYVSKLTIIGPDNGLSPGRRQAIIWTNAGILLIRTLGTNFSGIQGQIYSFSFKKMHLKMSSAIGRPFILGLNELIHWHWAIIQIPWLPSASQASKHQQYLNLNNTSSQRAHP